jgi:hypothetical protein
MAVEEKVVIKVEIDPDMTRAAAVNTFLATLDKNANKVNKTLRRTSDTFRKDLGKALAHTAARMADFGRALIKVNIKAFGIELALVTAGLLTMKAALATGNGIMKAWANTVKFARAATAGLAAGITVLVSTLAAANRQFTQFQLAPFVGGIKQARTAMSTLGVGSTSVMGVQALNQAMGSLAKSGTDVAKIAPIIRQIGNISGGDPKQFQALTKAMSTVQSTGKTAAGVKALQGLGPAFAGVAKTAGSMSGKQFMTSLASGGLTPQAFKGQLDTLDQTLMGGAKGMMTRMYTNLADMGSMFLDPLRNAMRDVEKVLGSGLFRMMGAIRQFGLNTFIPGFVDVLAKFIDWIVLLTNRDLPKLMGYLTSISEWWKDFKSGMSKFFGKMGDGMEKFSESAEIAWKMTKALFGEIKKFISGTFDKWDSGIVQNAAAFENFGRSLGALLVGVIDMLTRAKDAFFDIMPQLTSFFDFLSNTVFPALGNFASTFVQAFGEALPIIESIARTLMPLLEMLNMALGGVGGVPLMGPMLLSGIGMMTLTRGGRAGSAAFGRGAMDPNYNTAGLGVYSAVMAGMGKKLGGRFNVPGAVNSARGNFSRKLGMGISQGADGRWRNNKTGQFAKTPGRFGASMSRMGGKRLSVGMGAMGGLMGLSGVMSADTATSGAMSGAMGGASIGGMFGPWGALAGGIIGGLAGGIKGWLKRGAMKDAGRDLAATMVEETMEAMAGTGRAGRAGQLKELDDLLENEGALKALAEKEGADFGTLKSELQSERNALTKEQIRLDALLDDGLEKLAKTTGDTVEDIEKYSERLGILNLHTAAGRADYIIQSTSDYGSWNQSQISSQIEGAYWGQVRNGAFAKRSALEKAGEETRGATASLFASMEGGGPLDNDIADRAMQALMNEGQQLGYRGGALINWVNKSLRGMGGRAKELGWDVGAGAMSDFTQTGIAAGEAAKSEFMKGGFANQIKQRLTLLGEGDTAQAKLEKAWEMGDPDAYLANLNARLHNEQAETGMKMGAAAEDAGTALTGFAAVVQAILSGDQKAIDLFLNGENNGADTILTNQNRYGLSPTIKDTAESAMFAALSAGGPSALDDWNNPEK